MGSTIVIFVVVARLEGAETFGQFSFVMAFANVFAILAQFGTNESIGKGLVAFGKDDVGEFVGNVLLLRLALGVIAVTLAILVAFAFRAELVPILFIAALGAPFISARFFEAIYQVSSRPWYAVVGSIAYSTIYLGSSLLILIHVERPLLWLVVSYVGANL